MIIDYHTSIKALFGWQKISKPVEPVLPICPSFILLGVEPVDCDDAIETALVSLENLCIGKEYTYSTLIRRDFLGSHTSIGR